MSVYIKDMEMPKRCRDCLFAGYVDAKVELNVCMFNGHNQPTLNPGRMVFCPLVPVPEHGRLIDADVLFDFILNIYKNAKGDARIAYSDVLDTIVAAGDVIPASKEGNE